MKAERGRGRKCGFAPVKRRRLQKALGYAIMTVGRECMHRSPQVKDSGQEHCGVIWQGGHKESS